MNIMPELFGYVVPVLPMALVWLVGAVYALVSYRRHPGVSLAALTGCLLLLVSLVGGNALMWWIFQQGSSGAWDPSLSLGALGLVRAGLSTVGYALLLVAIFGWRSPPRRPLEMDLEPFDPRPPGDPDAIRQPPHRGDER